MAPKKFTPPSISRTVLPGSEKAPLEAAGEKPAPHSKRIVVSVVVRRKAPLLVANRLGKIRLTRSQYRQKHGADPVSVGLVRKFAKQFRLKVEPDTPGPERRTVKLSGTIADMQKAFGTALMHKTIDGTVYRIREGSIDLPSELIGHVDAVLGLDNRPQAHPHFRVKGQKGDTAARKAKGKGFAKPHAAADTSYTPLQIAQLYGFPAGATASDQTIAIVELGGGYRTADITAYFKSLGVTAPKVTAVLVDGAKNSPSNANSADGEVMLDIEVAAAVAPGAKIVVYFAPNTDQGFIDAVATAVHDTTNNPSVISISWGSAESNWTTQSLNALDAACQSAAALGITVTVAAGDDGSTDGETDGQNHVDFPGSSPHVLCCGGTNLQSDGSSITSETVWNALPSGGATGGGVSNFFPLPTWQANAGVPAPTDPAGGRGVPDVAGNADPATGYQVRIDGANYIIGGTSAVAPLWAGLIALANQQNGKPAGFIQPSIYTSRGQSAFNDITQGTNYTGTPVGFKAGPGWDACTGLGSPIAAKVITTINPPAASSARKMKEKKKKKRPAKPTSQRKPSIVRRRR
jgi:kumamolisin